MRAHWEENCPWRSRLSCNLVPWFGTEVCLVKAMFFFSITMYEYESWTVKESWEPKNWCFWTVVLEKTLESPLVSTDIQTRPFQRKSVLNIHWNDWCWNWNSNNLGTWCEELTHLKRPWCWERLKAGGEGDDRGWDGWIASLTQWVNSGIRWWTGRPGVLQFMGLQRVGHNWATELNWSGTFQIRELGGDWLTD